MQKNALKAFDEAYLKLKSIGQAHLLSHWDQLSDDKKAQLSKDILRIDPIFFETARELLSNDAKKGPHLSLCKDYEASVKPEWQEMGLQLLRQGKCAVVVLAGGSGSRLGFSGPKGMFPITRIKKKSLFQYLCEKVKAVSQLSGCMLEIAIMTSPANHEETINFFQNNGYFGLKQKQIHFFCQKEWPLFSLEGNLFLESPSKISFGPNGNGDAFLELYQSSIFKHFQNQGIEYLSLIPVENPLADPFDMNLLGFHHIYNADVAIKAVMRKHAEEKVGVIGQGGKVVEYSEIQRLKDESVLAFIGLFTIRLSKIESLQKVLLPLHKAKKAAKIWEGAESKKVMAWKFERFLFDIFPHLDVIKILCVPRKLCFAPLKNYEGEDSIAMVLQQLQEADRETYCQVSGVKVGEGIDFELSADFYYPTENLKKKWHGKMVPNNSYIGDT